MVQDLEKEIGAIRNKLRQVKYGVKLVAERVGCSEAWVQRVLRCEADGEAIFKVLNAALEIIEENLENQKAARKAAVSAFKDRANSLLATV